MMQHPIISGAGGLKKTRIGTRPAFEHAALNSNPLPAAAEALAGFDAVYQFSSDLLEKYVSTRIVKSVFEMDFREDALSVEINEQLQDAILGGSTSDAMAYDAAASFDYELVSDAFVVRFQPLQFRLPTRRADRARLILPVEILLRRVETTESLTSRRGVTLPEHSGGLPPTARPGIGGLGEGTGPADPIEETVLLGAVSVEVSANIVILTDVDTYCVRAKLDSSDWQINVSTRDQLIENLLGLETTGVHSGIISEVQHRLVSLAAISGIGLALTPAVSFLPNPPIDQSAFGDPADRELEVRHKVMPGNRPFSRVLCIGLNIGEERGDIEAVKPFTGEGNFAIAFCEEIVRSVVTSRWESANRSVHSTIEDIEYRVGIDGDERNGTGRALVTATFHSLHEVSLDIGIDETTPHSIRIAGEYDIMMDKLVLENGRELAPSSIDGDFVAPATEAFALHIFPFSNPPEMTDGPESPEFLHRLTAHLLQSIYLPFPGGAFERVQLTGGVHSPSGLFAMNGLAHVT